MAKMTKIAKATTELVDKTAETAKTATVLVDKTATVLVDKTATELVDKTANKTVKMLDNVIIRLVIYYVATTCLLIGISLLYPEFMNYLDGSSRKSTISAIFSFPQFGKEGFIQEPESANVDLLENSIWRHPDFVPVSLGLLFVFLYTLPVTWVYRWTRDRKNYNQDFVHTLLIAPIAIALVVFLVKDNYALAFGLAGIVAAVQFRTSLTTPLDATYMFMVIGIGLAAGIGTGIAAFLSSVAFNATILGVRRMNYGETPIVLSGFRIVHSAEERSLLSASDAQAKSRKYNAKLRVHTTQPKAAQQAVVAFLETYAKRWRQVQIVPEKDGTDIVEFDVRLKKTMDPAAFTRNLQKNTESYINNVELEL